MGSGYQDHGLIFVMPDGQPTHPNVISRWFDRAVDRSDLRRIRLHDLRHTHVNVMPVQQADAAASVAALVDG